MRTTRLVGIAALLAAPLLALAAPAQAPLAEASTRSREAAAPCAMPCPCRGQVAAKDAKAVDNTDWFQRNLAYP